MKRVGFLFEKAADFGALCRAARLAARGKAKAQSAASFIFHLETEVLRLQSELMDGSYRPRPYRTFSISDPKPRTISAADFRDRVAHHALCAVLEPLFERAAIADSYACRPGKGTHAAIRRAQGFARRFGFFLKLDVRKFFENADHEVLKRALRRLVKDRRLLELSDTLIDHGAPGSAPGKGLPIGNLTSQHFANHYLSPLDHFIKGRLRIAGYCRYMDDLLLFSDSKTALREAHDQVRDFLREDLKLGLRDEAGVLAPVSEGIPFLGLRLWPRVVRLDGPGKRRLIRGLRLAGRDLRGGRAGEAEVSSQIRSRLGHAEHAGARALRRALFAPSPRPDAVTPCLGTGALRAPTVSCAGAPGTTTRPTPAPRTATTTTRPTGTTTCRSGRSAELITPFQHLGGGRPDASHPWMQGPRPGVDQRVCHDNNTQETARWNAYQLRKR